MTLRSADDAETIRKRRLQIRAQELMPEAEIAQGDVLTEICKIVEIERNSWEADSALRERFLAFADDR